MPDKFDKHCCFKRMKLHQDEDWVGAFDGREGSGKSTGAIWDAYATSPGLFDLKAHICYDPEEFMRLVDDTPQYGTMILDEAGEAFFSRSFRDQLNIAIAKTLQQMRYRNLNVILCVPHKDYIDLVGRVRARSWTHFSATRRGYAEFLMPFRSKFYSRDEPYWKTLFYYQFSPLPAKVYNTYKEIKVTKSRERLAKYIEDAERKRDRFKDQRPTIEDVIKKVQALEDPASVCNQRGRYDSQIMMYELGFPQSLCRAAAKRLNKPTEEDAAV